MRSIIGRTGRHTGKGQRHTMSQSIQIEQPSRQPLKRDLPERLALARPTRGGRRLVHIDRRPRGCRADLPRSPESSDGFRRPARGADIRYLVTPSKSGQHYRGLFALEDLFEKYAHGLIVHCRYSNRAELKRSFEHDFPPLFGGLGAVASKGGLQVDR